jgi:hypothetical protein
MRDLNTAAPGFFHQVQELWWDDMLLHIFRMTDNRTDVLSVYTSLREVPAPLKPIVESHIAITRTATEFARHARHNSKAHRNPTNYDFLDNIGGVDSLLDIVDRGLKSRDA